MNDMEQLEQESEKVTIRKAKRKMALGGILMALGLVILIAAGILGVQTPGKVIAAVAATLVCLVVAVALMVQAMPDLAVSDIQKIEQKYSEQELTQLHGMKKNEAVQALRSHGFEADDSGYYHTKEFSVLKDSVSYYVKMLDSSNMEKTIRNEYNYLDQLLG